MKKFYWPLLLVVLLLAGCAGETTSPDTSVNVQSLVATTETSATKHDVSKFEKYKLQEVIDGDTIRIQYEGASEKVRFLLVDTPETKHETLGEQPFGPEAKQFMKELLKGEDYVYIEFDVSYRDKYKRLLGYMYTEEGISLQEELLKNGLARVAYIYDPNTKHVDWFESVQKTAQKSAIGIWSVEDYVTNRGYDKEAFNEAVKNAPAPVVADEEAPKQDGEACDIKGNINAKGNKIYHMPGQPNYEQTNAEEMFCTAEEAEAAGFVAAKN
ncbi:MAG: thermonuclease family protein [Caryophanon sp.]|nr:thermonuclease family protein [Caryophanon sp.]